MNRVFLKKGRERSVKRRHPWIFSGAIERCEGHSGKGDTVDVFSFDGSFLGKGAFSPSSQIRVRIWTDEDQPIDDSFFRMRIQASIARRILFGLPEETDAYRLISAEADGLPGLIVDRYRDFLVCQFLSAGSELWKQEIVSHLKELTGVQNVYDRSDVDVRKKEGLSPFSGVICGASPPSLLEVEEKDIKFLVDIKDGHKTGFYLDQRDNRFLVRSCSNGKKVLNCFAYTGGFGLSALKGGADYVINVEDRSELVQLIDKNVALNGFDCQKTEHIRADVFQLLRQFVRERRTFDLIVLDPPKFAESMEHLQRACRGYKDINMLAFRLLNPGGLLFTFSCSGLMRMELFQKIVADSAVDAGCDAQIIRWMGQSMDHPVQLCIPESLYLKGVMARMLG